MEETAHRRRLPWSVGVPLVAVPLAVAGVLALPTAGHADEAHAHATLRTAGGAEVGTVRFTVKPGRTEVSAHLRLPASAKGRDAFHGFHLHANDNPANGTGCLADPAKPASTWFLSADGHLSRQGQTHGAHQGDLPSLFVNADGTADLRFTTQRLKGSDLKGRAVVVHTGPDNFAGIPVGAGAEEYRANSPAAVAKTAGTGNSGDRLACGVVTLDGGG